MAMAVVVAAASMVATVWTAWEIVIVATCVRDVVTFSALSVSVSLEFSAASSMADRG